MTPDTPTIRLTVWRPARLGMRLLDPSRDVAEPFQDEALLEEVYSWQTVEDLLQGLRANDVKRVRNALFSKFSPHLPPAKRPVQELMTVVNMLSEAINRTPHNLRANPLLALVHHLRWVFCTFSSVPGASVVIR